MLASLVFLTPYAALFALAVLVPLAALALAVTRERRARELLHLPAPPPERRLPRMLAIATITALLAVAAAQPAIRRVAAIRVRTDAQVFVVLDISRSMRASSAPGAPTRLARAKHAAIELRNALPDVATGVATLTDRVLPQLFPNASTAVFADTVDRSVAIEMPPPSNADVRATDLGALGALGTQDFFPASAHKRVVVVFTDGESRPFDAARVSRQLGSVQLVLVHVWRANETVYDGRQPEPGYHADPASTQVLSGLASATGGSAVDVRSLGAAVSASRAELGHGPTAPEGTSEHATTLAPYVALAALVPLLSLMAPLAALSVLSRRRHADRPVAGRSVPIRGES